MKRRTIIFLIITILILAPLLSFGQSGAVNGSGGRIDNPLGNGSGDIWQFIQKVLTAVSELGAVIVVFFIIYSGFLFVTAQGNEEKLKKAKTALLWTLVGAAILLGAAALSAAIKGTITGITGA